MPGPLVALNWLDYFVILAYLGATMLIGYWVSKSIHTGSDYFLAGRSLPWWAVGFSLVATDIGGTDIVGLGGMTHAWGIAAANFDWIGCVPAMLIAAFVFIPHFWRCGITTIPELLERRFDVRLRLAVSFCWFVFMACNLGVMLVAAARFMEGLSQWNPWITILIVSTLVAVYTITGGLAAVVYTDVLQGCIMIGGCLLVTLMGLWEFGGWEPLHSAVEKSLARPSVVQSSSTERRPPPATHFDLVLPVDTPSPYPWPAILFGLVFVVSPAYWIGNQCIVQRSLAAKSVYEAKAAYVWGALLKNLIPLVIVIPGLMALAKFPHLRTDEERDRSLPMLIGTAFGPGIRGVFVAAFLAALMSSVDSCLNSATTLFVHDFYKRCWRPQTDERQMLRVGRTITLSLTLWSIAFAGVMLASQGSVYTIFQTLMSFIQGPAFAVLLAGLLTRRATSDGALAGFLAGVFTAVGLFLLNQPWIAEAVGTTRLFRREGEFLYFSLWSFAVAVSVTLLLSFTQPREREEKLKYVLTFRQTEESA